MAEGTGSIKAALWAFLAFALVGWILSIIGLAGAVVVGLLVQQHQQ
jgi:hypothetical protein